jgi:UPF0176 protein
MGPTYEVIIFYKYTPVADPEGFRDWIRATCQTIGINGRILVAKEGINGSVEGTREQLDQFESAITSQDGSKGTFGDFSDVWFKASAGTGEAFPKLKVKARENVLNIGLEGAEDIDPNKLTGTHIEAEELHKWFENNDEFEIIDMRNDYEIASGTFKGAIDPGTKNFRDLKEVLPELEHLKKKKVLTVCTYGIRCEKASGYLKREGFEDVYQLHGGIGTYMKKYPGQNFEGTLYVFDERRTEQFTDDYKKIGTCFSCESTSERYGNCAWPDCNRQLIICEECKEAPVWCDENCKSHGTTHDSKK